MSDTRDHPPPTVRLAVTTTMANEWGRDHSAVKRYPFHIDYRDPELPPPPTVRLAWPSGGNGCLSQRQDMTHEAWESAGGSPPTVRLAHHHHAQGDNVLLDPAPTVRLATTPAKQSQGQGVLSGRNGVERLPESSAPALLVSFFYLDPFLKNQARYRYRDWAMDSGAFSAHNSGATIDPVKYTETCARLLAEDPTLTEVFALDVIGDWRASLKNTEAMWAAGVPAIPTYHVGEPESVLLGLAKDYPKVALGGAVGYRGKDEWAAQCFARVWPKPIHGLGFGGEKSLMALPWHSVDATNWEIGPCKFGRWQAYGQMSVRGSKPNLRSEVEWYLALERRARARWAAEMAKLAALPVATGPTVRLAAQQSSDAQIQRSGLAPAQPSPAQPSPAQPGAPARRGRRERVRLAARFRHRFGSPWRTRNRTASAAGWTRRSALT